MHLSGLGIDHRDLRRRRHAGSQPGQTLFEFFSLTLDSLHLLMLPALAFFALFPLFAKPFLLYCSLARSFFFSFASLFRLARQLSGSCNRDCQMNGVTGLA